MEKNNINVMTGRRQRKSENERGQKQIIVGKNTYNT